ncbi:MAG: hypothetical protein ACYDD1_17945 [Caulobacteraceae bacterium]
MTNTIVAPPSVGPAPITVNTIAASGASPIIQPGQAYDITLTANCTLSLGTGAAGQYLQSPVRLRQDSTGGRSVTLPSGVTYSGGSAPVLNTAVGYYDELLFTYANGAWSCAPMSLAAAIPAQAAAPAITVLPGNGKLTVKLTNGLPPAANGSPITGYNIYVAGALAATNVALPYDVTGLTNGTAVAVQVAAVNGIEGTKTASASYTPAITAWTPAARTYAPAVYFDPLITSSITYGTSPAVKTIADQSANGYQLSQGTAAAQPAYIAPGSSNLGTGPALRFTASAGLLKAYTAAGVAVVAGAGTTGSGLVNSGNLTELFFTAAGAPTLVFGSTSVVFSGFATDGLAHLVEFH